jgi:hypothetical protein
MNDGDVVVGNATCPSIRGSAAAESQKSDDVARGSAPDPAAAALLALIPWTAIAAAILAIVAPVIAPLASAEQAISVT